MSAYILHDSGWLPLSFLTDDIMSNDKYPVVMAEDFIQLDFGEYEVQIDKNKFDIEQNGNSAIRATAKDNPNIKAVISIEKVPHGLDRNGMWKDTIIRDPLGTWHKMMQIEASLTGFNPELIINGHPGFDVLSSISKMVAYRICYWLEGEDSVNIFAAFPPESDGKDTIIALAKSLQVKKS